MDWNNALILGMESSCDETAIALVRGGRDVLVSKVASQTDIHERFGGVVPEVACRAHMEVLLPMLQTVLEEAEITPDAIDGIAVTNRPGLIGALLIGVSAAKALALAWNKPIVGVNHIEAHIAAAKIAQPELTEPFIALVVSGGHTTVYLCHENGDYERLCNTLDDAAGEAFDKVASVLGLPYPGGPSIQRVAALGNPKAYPWKNSCLTKDGVNFSFSGIKTAVLYAARGQKAGRKGPLLLDEQGVADAAASFQRAAVHALVTRTVDAAKRHGVGWIALGGGVAANAALREGMQQCAETAGLRVAIPPMNLCTDNGVMIAARGWDLFRTGHADELDLATDARALPGDSQKRRG